jgi:hypothetical protein
MPGRYEEALALDRQILTRAQKEAFNPLPIHIELAEVYSGIGRVKEAHTQALEVLRIDPGLFVRELEQNAALQGCGTSSEVPHRATQSGTEVRDCNKIPHYFILRIST